VDPFLTIAIPTYARAQRLARLLTTLEVERVDGLHVVVSDNASPDETQAVTASFPWVEARRQPENVGAVENARRLLARAEGDYVWLLGDDDCPAPGAIAEIVSLLRERRPRWLHLPHGWLRDDGSSVGESLLPDGVEEYDGSAALHRRYHHWLSFISAQVIESRPIADIVTRERVRGCFAPYGWFFLAGLDGRCVVGDRRYVIGAAETSWDDRRGEILTRDIVTLYDDALGRGLDRAEFADMLDHLYKNDLYLDCWQQRPLEELAQAVQDFPESRQLRRFLWLIARERDRLDCLSPLAGNADELVEEGERRYADGDTDGALAAFLQAVEQAPLTRAGWNDLGVVLNALGRRSEARAALETALWLDPADADAAANLEAVA
jgi:glycosyltransferase involved in cell wall biosynthesis